MHVEAPSGPAAAEGGRKDPHVAHAEDQVDPRIFQRRRHLQVKFLARAALRGRQAGSQSAGRCETRVGGSYEPSRCYF